MNSMALPTPLATIRVVRRLTLILTALCGLNAGAISLDDLRSGGAHDLRHHPGLKSLAVRVESAVLPPSIEHLLTLTWLVENLDREYIRWLTCESTLDHVKDTERENLNLLEYARRFTAVLALGPELEQLLRGKAQRLENLIATRGFVARAEELIALEADVRSHIAAHPEPSIDALRKQSGDLGLLKLQADHARARRTSTYRVPDDLSELHVRLVKEIVAHDLAPHLSALRGLGS